MKRIMSALLTIGALAPVSNASASVELSAEAGQPVLPADRRSTTYLKIGVTGGALEAKERPPVNIAIVLDRSSSMSGDKIRKAKQAAMLVLDRLAPGDIVSLIAYDSNVEVLVPATKVTDPDAIKRRIQAIAPRGSTALFGGVSRGLEEVRKFLDDERVNRVILLSDGQANVGPRSPNELGRLGASAGKEGISITTIGLGLGYNEDLMEQLARRSDGNHAFAETGEQLVQIFDYELNDVLSVVAQELAIRAVLPEGVRPVRCLNRDVEIHGQEVVMTLNQLYARQHKYFLLEVEATGLEAGGQLRLADVRLSYDDLVQHRTERKATAVAVRFSRSPAEIQRAENERVMIDAVEAIAVLENRTAVALRDQGQLQEAKQKLIDNAAWLEQNATKYRSTRLGTYGKRNLNDAANVEDDLSWSRQRKSMRKEQFERETQQSY